MIKTQPSLLVISPCPSHPADQGSSARIQAFGAEVMARGIAADFLYYGMEGLTREQEAEMSRFWRRLVFMPSLPLARPSHPDRWGLDDWCPQALCDRVREIHAAGGYDAVLVNYVWMSRVLVGLNARFSIIDTHDLFGDRHTLSAHHGLEPRWYFTGVEEEARGFSRADCVIGIQDQESATIRSRTDRNVITVGHPSEPRFLFRSPASAPHWPFGYLGSGNPWNVRSVTALDGVLAGRPVKWALAGTISRRNLALRSGPYRMGMVDTLERFYDSVDCVLNPMLGGTGLKIKTIEALAFGKPVIGTHYAFEGLHPTHAFHRLDRIEAMAGAIEAYQSSAQTREELLLASRELYLRYMARVSSQYDTVCSMIAGAQRGRAPAASVPDRRGNATPRLPLRAVS